MTLITTRQTIEKSYEVNLPRYSRKYSNNQAFAILEDETLVICNNVNGSHNSLHVIKKTGFMYDSWMDDALKAQECSASEYGQILKATLQAMEIPTNIVDPINMTHAVI